jgi:hypothetical protein
MLQNSQKGATDEGNDPENIIGEVGRIDKGKVEGE